VVELYGVHLQVKNRTIKYNLTLACRVILPPKSQPAPRGLTAQLSMSSGSDHMRSITYRKQIEVQIRDGGRGPTTKGTLVGDLLCTRQDTNLV